MAEMFLEKIQDFHDVIRLLEEHLQIKAQVKMLPMQLGDVEKTASDIAKARERLGYDPKTDLASGVKAFCAWYSQYYTSCI